MWDFYKTHRDRGQDNKYTQHFGDPLWVYYQYRLPRTTKRSKRAIYAEGRKKIEEVEPGVLTGQRHGAKTGI